MLGSRRAAISQITALWLLTGPVSAASPNDMCPWPAEWQKREVQMKWTLEPHERRDLLQRLSTADTIEMGAGSDLATYEVVPKYGGRPRRYVDVYYDLDGRLELNHVLVRHRAVWEADIPDSHLLHLSQRRSGARDRFTALNENSSWKYLREEVQFKQTTARVGAAWFRTEAGKCTVKGSAEDDPPCVGSPLEPEQVVKGEYPQHPTSERLRHEFPDLVQSSLTRQRKVDQYRFRVELRPRGGSTRLRCPTFPVRLSVDLVRVLEAHESGWTATGEPTAELELEFDPDRELRYLSVECVKQRMDEVAAWLMTTSATLKASKETKGGIHVPDRCALDACELELAEGEEDPELESDPQEQARARSRRSERNGRAIWCGTQSELRTLHALAVKAAPIIWFAPDEPLLYEGKQGCRALPEAINIPWSWEPGECGRRVVYYRVEKIDDRDPEAEPTSYYEPDSVRLAETRKISLRYLLYYPRDAGTNAHLCDLESVYFEITIDELVPRMPPEAQRFRTNLTYVKAAAHGMNWLGNRLRVARHWYSRTSAPDTLLPVTILVEEGKHGSGTDRNGDGVFSPGYDVNDRVSDAWGIRDTFGSGLLKRLYTPEQTKPRRPEHRIFPDLPRLSALRARYETRYTWNEAATYTLKPAVPPSAPAEGLKEYYACVKPAEKETTRWIRAMDLLPVSWRYDGNESLSIVTFPVPLGNVYATPRFIVSKGPRSLRGSGVQVTPSWSRWLDWYGAVGWQAITEDADVTDSSVFRDAFTYEFGVRFRFKPLWLNEHLPFLGARVGLRMDGFQEPGRPHLVFEVGGGFQ